jgi:hypothetical protein
MFRRALLFITTIAFALNVQGTQAGSYEETMKAAIQELYGSEDVAGLSAATNKLARIANAEETKWRPFYYASYGSLMEAVYSMNTDRSKMDPLLDKAQEYIDKATAIDTNVETIILQGYIHMIRLTVDPATRGQQYSGLSMQLFGKALSMDPENPRALTLMGQMKMGTAQFFGQDSSEGCAMVAKSVSMYDSYKTENELDPTWGREFAESVTSNCQ